MYKNFLSIIVNLCKKNSTPKKLGLFIKLYSLLVLSGLFFSYSAGGVALELITMTKDVKVMAQYNRSEPGLSFLEEAIEETHEKMRSTKTLQLNGLVIID